MTVCRKVPFLTFVVDPYRKAKINLSGCNFDCKGCFALAKQEIGRAFSVEGLLDLLVKSCQFLYGEMVDDVQFTGGEPTTNKDYLISSIKKLRKLNVKRIGFSTNGHLLDRSLVAELKFLDVNYIKLDIKAYTAKIHAGYTGTTNTYVLRALKLLHEYNLNFYARTIFTPPVIGFDEIEKIAGFLSKVDRTIAYKIYQFAPEQVNKKVSKAPTQEEMQMAYSIAKKYLDNVEFYTTETAYKPDRKYVEIWADELLDRFKKINEIAKSVIKDWHMEYYTMNQILNS